MRKIFRSSKGLIISFIFLLLWNQSFSKDCENDSLDCFSNGSYAFQFKYDRYFTFNSFRGSILSIKKHFSKNKAIRLGLSARLEDTNKDEGQLIEQQTDYWRQREGNYLYNNIGVDLDLVIYPNPYNTIKFYYGFGPTFYYNERVDNMDSSVFFDSYTGETYRRDKLKEKMFKYGVNLIWGVEWFPHKSISIVAEYGLNFSYSILDREDFKKSGDDEFLKIFDEKTSEYSIDSVDFKIGVSIYFTI